MANDSESRRSHPTASSPSRRQALLTGAALAAAPMLASVAAFGQTPTPAASATSANDALPQRPLSMGYLTGAITADTTFGPKDFRTMFPRFTPQARRINRPVGELLQRVGQRMNATPGQVALAWLMALKPWIVPIPEPTNAAHLDRNLRTLAIKLSPGDMKEIEDGFSRIHIEGARATEALLVRSDLGARLGTSSVRGHGMTPSPGTVTQ